MTNAQSRTLHVLMISDVYFPRINGVSTSIETFRSDLADHGIDVTLIAPAYPEHEEGQQIHRVRSWRLPFDPEDRLMSWPELVQVARTLGKTKPIDMVHVQTPFAAHYAGTRLVRELGLPLLATYHTHFEEYFHHYLPLLPRPWLQRAARSLVRRQCAAYDAIVVPSHAMRKTLGGYGVQQPMHILPTGIPIAMFEGGRRNVFRQRHGIGAERKVALFVGRVAHEKNIGFLLDAALHARQLLPEFLLVVAGDGPALGDLRRRVRAEGLEAHVQFIGYLDRHAELADCYAAADVFAFASKTETQGLVLLEAMAAGLPVYALSVLGTRDILESQRGAVIAADDSQAFARGLAELLQDEPKRRTLSDAARSWAAEWSAPERARQLACLYRTLQRPATGSSASH